MAIIKTAPHNEILKFFLCEKIIKILKVTPIDSGDTITLANNTA
jgi:hypothetical protein